MLDDALLIAVLSIFAATILAALIARVGLACVDNLDRANFLGDPTQPFEVAEEQVGSLVRGRAAGEADGEYVRVEAPDGSFAAVAIA